MKAAIVALVAISMMAGTAMAQTSAAPSTAPAAAGTTAGKAPVARTAKSLACSKQADAKSLHGKPRKHFMSTCKKA